jgi:hypothetical protein
MKRDKKYEETCEVFAKKLDDIIETYNARLNSDDIVIKRFATYDLFLTLEKLARTFFERVD